MNQILPRTTGGLILAALVLSGCKRSQPMSPPPPPTVTAALPSQREVIEWDQFPGRLEAVDMVEIRARVNGYLLSVHFKDGAQVKKGDLLFVIDPRPYQAELERQEAALRQAETRLEWTRNEATRAERLVKSRAMSEEEVDSRRKAAVEAEAGLQSARAAVEAARLNLEYTRITAPISGRTSRKLITEGNLVNGNQGQSTLLTTVVSMDPIYCYFDADEASVLKYQRLAREGEAMNLRNGKVICEVSLANEEGFPHQGVLDFVDNQLNPNTGTLQVRGVLDNPGPDYVLQPGFFARVRVPGSEPYPALLVPDQAVGTDQGRRFVYVADGPDSVEYRAVTLGPVLDGMRVVREGLKPQEWVVVNGLMSIRPGAKVKVDRVTTQAAQATPGASGKAVSPHP